MSQRSILWLGLASLAAALGALLGPAEALAVTKTWTGLSGSDSNWQTDANWSGGTRPNGDDDLVFPAGAPRADTSHNDFAAGTSFNSITFNGSGAGYTIDGNRISLVAGITDSATGAHTDNLNIALTLAADETVEVTNGSVTLVLGGAIGGSGVGLTKTGAGTLRFTGAGGNTYGGTTTVNDGALELGKSSGAAIAGPLAIGDGTGTSTVFLLADNQITNSASVTVAAGSIFNLLGFTDTIGGLTLSSGTTSGASVITGAGTLSLDGNATLIVGGTGATGASISGNLNLITDTRTFTINDGAAAADLTISAVISGSAGAGLTKTGTGTLRFSGSGSNTYPGTTTVNAGALELGKTSGGQAIAGPLVVGDGSGADTVRLLGNNQIANSVPITVAARSTLDLNGFSDTIGDLALSSGPVQGAQVTTGAGTLTLGGDVTVTASGTGSLGAGISGNLALTTALHTFEVADGLAAADLDLSAVISGALGSTITKTGVGTLRLSGTSANPFTGALFVLVGTVELQKTAGVTAVAGSVQIGAGSATTPATLRLLASNQIGDTVFITLLEPGVLDLNGFSDTIGGFSLRAFTTSAAQVTTGAGTLTVNNDVSLGTIGTGATGASISGHLSFPSGLHLFTVADGAAAADLTVSAAIAGAGAIEKLGPGTLVLSGNNTYTGGTAVLQGTLLVNGAQPQSAVTLTGGTLGGTGTVGAVAATGGTLAPGQSPGVLATGNVTLSASSSITVELNGATAGTQYDQLNVTGTVDLAGAALNVSLGFTPLAGTLFTIVNNDGTDAVSGTFAGLPPGAVLAQNNVALQVNYAGGTNNNDVVLAVLGTLTPTPTNTPTPTRTPTPTVTPTPFPRPNVGVAVAPAGGTLQATITARDAGCAGGNNQLQSLVFTKLTNATVDVATSPVTTVSTTPRTVSLPAHPASIGLTVHRVAAGQAATVELTVTDGCGAWPTLVGGGPSAF